MRTPFFAALIAVLALAGCGGGGGSGSTTGTSQPPSGGCSGSCADTSTLLTVAEVERVLAQGVAEAKARDVRATLAVVDRVGNVLGVYRMGADPLPVLIATATDDEGRATVSGGLEGIALPQPGLPFALDHQAAIAKAVTGAYLSSEGNAFTTRTAGQIVQEHFNPGERDQAGGPLFGVQFSQLACSDFMQRADGLGVTVGPQRSPLGLSADPGGMPLYKNGTVVGGVGAIADGRYSLDKFIADSDRDVDELIATAATFGFAAPPDRRADRITVDGKTFRFSDVEFSNLARDPASAPGFSTLTAADGGLVPVPGYTDGNLRQGVSFGDPASGIRPDTVDFPGQDAFIFVDASDQPRFPPRAGTDGGLSENEVRVLLREALAVANRARAQIRRPLGSQARVTISVVDTRGEILGMVRTRDAPVFGADVSLQKARSATLFSAPTAAEFLTGLPAAQYLTTASDAVSFTPSPIGTYITDLRAFTGMPTLLGDGAIAFAERSIANLSRPFYPDGLQSEPHGPLSKPFAEWSAFSTGLQLDLAHNAILQHVLFVAGVGTPDVGTNCAGIELAASLVATQTTNSRQLANGLQIFPGGVPLYRGTTLVGGIGVSGDGVDQDDMIAFLGAHNGGIALNGSVGNAPRAQRADTLTPRDVRLRYVQCPQAPFRDSSEEDVCVNK
ncbi:MAG: heme-binding protein [Pseudomonadales bacterium]